MKFTHVTAFSLVVSAATLLSSPAFAGGCPTCESAKDCAGIAADAVCVEWNEDPGCGGKLKICCPGQGCATDGSGNPSCVATGKCKLVTGSAGAGGTAGSAGSAGAGGGSAGSAGAATGGSAGAASGGTSSGTGGSAGAAPGGKSEDDGGCGCRVPAAPSRGGAAALGALLLGLIARRRRR